MLDNLTLEDIEFLLEHRVEEFTEDQIEFLTESRVEFIKNANKDKISTDHDPESANMSSDKIVDHIASKIDPTSRKEHTQWLVNRYKSGDFKLSDAKEIKKSLSKFDEAKQHLEKKDLNSIKSISELKDHVSVVAKKVDLHKAEKEDDTPKEMETVFSEGGAVGYKVPSKATSIRNYGPNGKLAKTTWCTAAEGSRNMFSGYSGGKYTLHLPGDGGVLQLHHQSNQMMDEHDVPVNIRSPKYAPHADTIKKFIHTTHALEGSPESSIANNNPLAVDPNDLEKHIDDYKESFNKATAEYKNYLPYHVEKPLKEKAAQISKLVEQGSLTDSAFEKLRQFPTSNRHDEFDNEDYSIFNAKSPEAKPEHLAKMADSLIPKYESDKGYHKADLSIIASNHNVSPDVQHKIIGSALNKGDHELAQLIAKNGHNLQKEHIDRLTSKFDVSRELVANQSADVPAEHFDKAFSVDAPSLASTMGQHPNVPDHIVKKILSTKEGMYYHYGTIENPKVNKETIMSHYEDIVHNRGAADLPIHKILDRNDITGEDVDRVVNLGLHKNNKVSTHWYKHSKLTRDHIHQIMKADNRLDDFDDIMSAAKIKSEDIDTLIKHPKFDTDKYKHAKAVVSSHAVKAKNIDTMLDKGVSNHVAKALLDTETSPKVLNHEHLSKLAAFPGLEVHRKHQILNNPNVQLSHFNAFKDDIRMHGAISSSKHAPPSILHSLATSPLDHVRLNVAKNPNTEERTHRILAGDAISEIANIASKKVKK